MQTRSWTGNDNLAHTITEIVIDDMMVLSPRREGTPAPVVAEPVAEKKTTKKTKEEAPEESASEKVPVEDIHF